MNENNYFFEQNLKEYFAEVDIAEHTFQEQKLNGIVKNLKIVCDIYCIPSHNHQAFFCKLFEDEKDYTILYAKTFIINRFGHQIAMYTFSDCVRAQNHNGSVGKIICGTIKLNKNNKTINQLIECLPQQNEWQKNGIMIDGVHTIIRNHQHKDVKLLSYASNVRCTENFYSEAQKVFLENLYLHIENIIGNVLDK